MKKPWFSSCAAANISSMDILAEFSSFMSRNYLPLSKLVLPAFMFSVGPLQGGKGPSTVGEVP